MFGNSNAKKGASVTHITAETNRGFPPPGSVARPEMDFLLPKWPSRNEKVFRLCAIKGHPDKQLPNVKECIQ